MLSAFKLFCATLFCMSIAGEARSSTSPSTVNPADPNRPILVQVNDNRTVNIDQRTDRRTVVIVQKPQVSPQRKLTIAVPKSVREYFEILKARLVSMDTNLTTNLEDLDLAQQVEGARLERTWMKVMGGMGALAGACLSVYCLSDVGADFFHSSIPSIREYFDAARDGILNIPGAKFVFPIVSGMTGASVGVLAYIIAAGLIPDSKDPMLIYSLIEIKTIALHYEKLLAKSKTIAGFLAGIHSIERAALLRLKAIALRELAAANKRGGSSAEVLQVQIHYVEAMAGITSLTAASLARIEKSKPFQVELMSLAEACGSRTNGLFEKIPQ